MLLFAILSCLFLTKSNVEADDNPIQEWRLDSSFVLLDRDVKIVCVVKNISICHPNKWNWISSEGQLQVLLFDGSPEGGNKYRQITTSNSFTLVIPNITEREIYGSYVCVCNFSNRSGHIPLDKVVVIPKSNEVTQSVNRTSESLHVFISIARINPIPECSCLLGENRQKLSTVKEKIGLHYQVYWSLNHTMSDRERCALVTVQCKMPSAISNDLWKGIYEQDNNSDCKGNSGSKSLERVGGMWMILATCYTLYIIILRQNE